MQSPPALPPNFTISEKAQQKISDWIDHISEEKQRAFIPAIFLATITSGGKFENETPVIGAYLLSNVDNSDIFECNGLRFVFPVLEKEYDLFDGKILDIKDNKYILI